MVDSFTQTNYLDEENNLGLVVENEPLIIGGFNFGSSDYHDAYRDGNFGVRRGRINFHRARKWCKIHLIIAVFVLIVSIVIVCLMETNNRYWVNHDTMDAFAGLSITCGIISIFTASSSFYLVGHITTMKKPLFVLLLTRLLAFIGCLLTISAFITTIVNVSNSHQKDPYISYWDHPTQAWQISQNYGLFTFLSTTLAILLIIDFVASIAWLFHWWRCCACCEVFKPYCIYEHGVQLAEGVPDPRTGILKECLYVCWATYKSDWGII